jgi:hypothetical protein
MSRASGSGVIAGMLGRQSAKLAGVGEMVPSVLRPETGQCSQSAHTLDSRLWACQRAPGGRTRRSAAVVRWKPHDLGDCPARRYSIDTSGLSKLAGYLRKGHEVDGLGISWTTSSKRYWFPAHSRSAARGFPEALDEIPRDRWASWTPSCLRSTLPRPTSSPTADESPAKVDRERSGG